MNKAMLADLDELILLCRNKLTKSYIIEAINCYHAGAFRASIVATWVAVCYDIHEKIRELSMSGDSAAQAFTTHLEKIRAGDDRTRMTMMERDLVKKAHEDFAFLSPIEREDLDRLREDRHRCAHPSMISDSTPFQPCAESARLHIRNAVIHLLQHPPTQGRAALEQLQREISNPYFPTDIDLITTQLAHGPLNRPRERAFSNPNCNTPKSLN